jgi:predicted metal-binding protein
MTAPTWITVCDTCKREGWAGAGATDGERLAGLIEAQAAAEGLGRLRLRRFSCLMGCTHGCNVAVQA